MNMPEFFEPVAASSQDARHGAGMPFGAEEAGDRFRRSAQVNSLNVTFLPDGQLLPRILSQVFVPVRVDRA